MGDLNKIDLVKRIAPIASAVVAAGAGTAFVGLVLENFLMNALGNTQLPIMVNKLMAAFSCTIAVAAVTFLAFAATKAIIDRVTVDTQEKTVTLSCKGK